MLTVYRKLLRLYPQEHRELFGEEMAAVWLDAWAEYANRSWIDRGRFHVREVAGLVRGALHEHARLFLEFQDGLSLSKGRFTMRNGFRFPKTTIAFMALILACVVWAIKMGENIAGSVSNVGLQVGPIHSVRSTLLSPIPLYLGFFYAAGLIGWAILFALRRSGVHRLADMSGHEQ